jgi:hypothetical protein
MADLGKVGEARVELRATSKKLAGDLKKAKGNVGKAGVQAGTAFASSFVSIASKTIVPGLAAIFAAISFKKLLDGGRKAVDTLSEIGDAAKSIGLSTDALQELRVAAVQSGLSIGQLDSAMRRYVQSVDELRRGRGEGGDALARLGISAVDASGKFKSAQTIFNETADVISDMSDQTAASAAAIDIFGESGAKMLPVLNNGSAGLKKMAAEARKLGIIIDADLIRRADEAGDELELLEQIVSTQVTVALADLAPILIGIAGFLADVATGAANAYNGLRALLGLRVGAIQVPQIQGEIAETSAAIQELEENFRSLAETGMTAAEAALPFASAPQGKSAEEVNTLLEGVIERRAALQDRLDGLQKELQDTLNSTGEDLILPGAPPPVKIKSSGGGRTGESEEDKRAKAVERLRAAIDKQIKSETALRQEVGNQISVMGEEEGARDGLIEQLKIQQLEEQILRDAKAAGLELTDAEIQGIREQIQLLQIINGLKQEDQDNLEKQTEAQDRAREATERMNAAFQATSDELVAAAFEGGNFIEILAKLALKILEIQLLKSFGGSEGNIGGGGSGGFLGAILGAVVTGVAGGIGGAAEGGRIEGPGTGTSDSIVAKLSDGEFVINAKATQKNLPLLEAINDGRKLPSFSRGGITSGVAGGGKIEGPGTSTSDSILAQLSDGEFVVNAKATQQTLPILEAINDGRKLPSFALGGIASNFQLPGQTPAQRFDNLAGVFNKGDMDLAEGGGFDTGGRGVSVTMNIQTPDVGGFRRSQSLVSAEVGRMIRLGQSRQD